GIAGGESEFLPKERPSYESAAADVFVPRKPRIPHAAVLNVPKPLDSGCREEARRCENQLRADHLLADAPREPSLAIIPFKSRAQWIHPYLRGAPLKNSVCDGPGALREQCEIKAPDKL